MIDVTTKTVACYDSLLKKDWDRDIFLEHLCKRYEDASEQYELMVRLGTAGRWLRRSICRSREEGSIAVCSSVPLRHHYVTVIRSCTSRTEM